MEKQRPGGGDERGSTAPTTPSGGPGGGGPGIGVRVVAAVTVLEAVGLAALAGWGVTRLVAGAEPDVGTGVFLVAFALAVAVVLVVCARALLAGRRSGRAPVATWQLLQGATAFALGSATGLAAAWVVLALSALVFVLLMTPPVVAQTVGSRPR